MESKLVESDRRAKELESTGKKEMGAAKKALKEMKSKLVEAEKKLTEKEEEVKGPKAQAGELEKELNLLRLKMEEVEGEKENASKLASEQLEKAIQKKEKVLSKIKEELKDSMAKMEDVKVERDAALASIKELHDGLKAFEKRLVDQSTAHEIDLKDLEQEKESAIFTAREEVAQHVLEVSLLTTDVADKEGRIVNLSNQLAERDDKILTLQRTLDGHLLREQQRTSLSQSQKAGTDGVRSRLAGLQAHRSDTPTPTSSSRTRSSGLGSSLGSNATTRKSSGPSPLDQELQVTHLQLENAGYLVKIADLERQTQALALEVEQSKLGASSPTSSSSRSGSMDLGREHSNETARMNALIREKELALSKERDVSEAWAKVRFVFSYFGC